MGEYDYDFSNLDPGWYSGLENVGWEIGQPQGGYDFYNPDTTPDLSAYEIGTNFTPNSQAVFTVDEGTADQSGSTGLTGLTGLLSGLLSSLFGGTGTGTASGSALGTLLSSLLGTGLTAAGTATSSTPKSWNLNTVENTSQNENVTTQKPLTAESSALATSLQALISKLSGLTSLNPTQQTLYNQTTGPAIQSYLNPVSAEYTDALKSLILPTQQAIEASTSQALNKMAPRTLSLGPQVANIVGEVSQANTAERNFANQIYQYLSNQATAANAGYGERAQAALQLAGAPEAQQSTVTTQIAALTKLLTDLYQGGAAQTTTGQKTATTGQTTAGTTETASPSLLSSLLTSGGSSLLNNPNTLNSLLQLLGLGVATPIV